MTISGFEVYPPILLLGLVVGLTYGLLGVGLVLVYRSSAVLNLAHAQIGVFGAVVLAFLVLRWEIPYWVAFVVALAVGCLAAALVELAAVRRLRRAPPVMSFIATLGAGQILTFLSLALYARVQAPAFPQPPGFPELRVGALLVSPAFSALLVAGPLAVLALAVFLRTPLGLAVRAAAADASLARLTAVSPGRMSLVAWGAAGALSALTAVLVIPVLAPLTPSLSGPELLLRALAVAVVARMDRLGLALGAGVGLGVVEQLFFWNYPRSSLQELLVAGIVLVALLVLRARPGDEQEAETRWRALQAWRPALPGSPAARRLRYLSLGLGALAAAAAMLLITVLPSTTAVVVPLVAAYAVVGMSVLLLTGLLGELSLCQFALAAIGGVLSIRITLATGNFFLGFAGAVAAGAGVALAVSAPALRLRRVMLPAATLAFAVATHLWLLPQPWVVGDGVDPGRPVLGGLRFDTFRSYACLAVVLLLLAMVVVANATRGATRRRFVAVRDDEAGARAFGIDVARTKLLGFAVAGGLAGFAGAVYAHLLPLVDASSFPLRASFSVVAIAALGGLAWPAGPVLGALWVVGLPTLIGAGDLVLATTAFGWLVLVLYVPGGLAQLAAPLRSLVLGDLATSPVPGPSAAGRSAARPPTPLEVRGATKTYGKAVVLEEVCLEVRPGETVALVGPNGAGKTTLVDIVSGHLRPDAGQVRLAGVDVTSLPAQLRARRGVVRSFQTPRLFATLTVHEVIALAHEQLHATSAVAELLGAQRRYRRNLDAAAQTAEVVGLTPYLDRYVYELSAGMRRITDLACAVARQPRLLLLDEPSAGVARAELPHLIDLVRQVRAVTGAGVLLVEHDMHVVQALADRVVRLHLGRVVDDLGERYLGGTLWRGSRIADEV